MKRVIPVIVDEADKALLPELGDMLRRKLDAFLEASHPLAELLEPETFDATVTFLVNAWTTEYLAKRHAN